MIKPTLQELLQDVRLDDPEVVNDLAGLYQDAKEADELYEQRLYEFEHDEIDPSYVHRAERERDDSALIFEHRCEELGLDAKVDDFGRVIFDLQARVQETFEPESIGVGSHER